MNIKILLFAGTAALAPLAGHAEGETHHLAIISTRLMRRQ